MRQVIIKLLGKEIIPSYISDARIFSLFGIIFVIYPSGLITTPHQPPKYK